jgi:Tol biopolymer transport system component
MSPDGQTIFYLSGGGGSPAALWRMHTDGSEPTLVFDEGITLLPPVWSPDGQWVAFGQQRSLRLVNAQSNEMFLVEAQGSPPIWSPDSHFVASGYSPIRDGRGHIPVIDALTR